jgi:hypothetical protein
MHHLINWYRIFTVNNTIYLKAFSSFIVFLFVLPACCFSQEETISLSQTKKDSLPLSIDTVVKKKPHSPKIAATRSAILPGWGQVYNKKYWKLPIVYGGLGVTAGVFVYNLKNYKDLKQAYIGKYNAREYKDSTEYWKIKPNLLPLSEESIRFNRDQFRRNLDYSVLIFLLIWGVNVVDATVDAHMKSFDIGPDLSLKIQPGRSEMAGTNGLSLVFTIGR